MLAVCLALFAAEEAQVVGPTPAALHGSQCKANSPAVQLIGVDGNPLTMACANYFGCACGYVSCPLPSHRSRADWPVGLGRFNNGQTMLDGLYAGSDELTMDYGEVLYRIQA